MSIQKIEGDLTNEAFSYFTSVENIGVPFKDLLYFLNLDPDQKEVYEQMGVPYEEVDSLNMKNELKAWLKQGRLADPNMRFAIRGDGNAPFETTEQVLNTMREMRITRMSLITNMEDPPTEGVGL